MKILFVFAASILSLLAARPARAQNQPEEKWEGLAVARLELGSLELRKEFGKPVEEFTATMVRELTLYTFNEDIAVPGLWTILIVTGQHKEMGPALAVYKQRVQEGSRKELITSFSLTPGTPLDVARAVKETMRAFVKHFPKNKQHFLRTPSVVAFVPAQLRG